MFRSAGRLTAQLQHPRPVAKHVRQSPAGTCWVTNGCGGAPVLLCVAAYHQGAQQPSSGLGPGGHASMAACQGSPSAWHTARSIPSGSRTRSSDSTTIGARLWGGTKRPVSAGCRVLLKCSKLPGQYDGVDSSVGVSELGQECVGLNLPSAMCHVLCNYVLRRLDDAL